jgi:hypothetical protein
MRCVSSCMLTISRERLKGGTAISQTGLFPRKTKIHWVTSSVRSLEYTGGSPPRRWDHDCVKARECAGAGSRYAERAYTRSGFDERRLERAGGRGSIDARGCSLAATARRGLELRLLQTLGARCDFFELDRSPCYDAARPRFRLDRDRIPEG